MVERWLGKPIAKNKPHNIFKSNQTFARMFRDNDRDGVANVFDCKPNNPREQGLIDTILSVFSKKKKLERAQYSNPPENLTKQQKIDRIIAKRVEVQDRAALNRINANKGTIRRTAEDFLNRITTKRMFTKKGTRDMSYADYLRKRAEQQRYGGTPNYIGRREKTLKKVAQEIFPFQTYTKTDKATGVPGRKGRPRGTLDPRYAAYGGVYAYRRYLFQQKKLAKQVQAQQAAQGRMQNIPQYETQQYSPQETQVPQQISSAELQAIQQAQMQEQMRMQPQPQAPPQPIRRPIATVFKGSGGKPYPAVENRPLTPARQTVPYGYVEEVDSFTGRRFIKQLPKPERWSSS